MSHYAIVNGTYLVPSTAVDQFVRIYFRVLVPTQAKIPLSTAEDISVAAYVIQDYWAGRHGWPPLEQWPNQIALESSEIDTVLTMEAIESMKKRLASSREAK